MGLLVFGVCLVVAHGGGGGGSACRAYRGDGSGDEDSGSSSRLDLLVPTHPRRAAHDGSAH